MVFAVIRYWRGNAQVIAVYGSMERAKAWIDRQDDGAGLDFDVEEHVLDQDPEADEE